MATKVYGASDDCIEFEGDIHGEAYFHGKTDTEDAECLLLCSDGTVLGIRYGKGDRGIWALTVHRKGDLFRGIDPCDDEDAGIYSDVANFADGLKWAYAAKDWERIK